MAQTNARIREIHPPDADSLASVHIHVIVKDVAQGRIIMDALRAAAQISPISVQYGVLPPTIITGE